MRALKKAASLRRGFLLLLLLLGSCWGSALLITHQIEKFCPKVKKCDESRRTDVPFRLKIEGNALLPWPPCRLGDLTALANIILITKFNKA